MFVRTTDPSRAGCELFLMLLAQSWLSHAQAPEHQGHLWCCAVVSGRVHPGFVVIMSCIQRRMTGSRLRSAREFGDSMATRLIILIRLW